MIWEKGKENDVLDISSRKDNRHCQFDSYVYSTDLYLIVWIRNKTHT